MESDTMGYLAQRARAERRARGNESTETLSAESNCDRRVEGVQCSKTLRVPVCVVERRTGTFFHCAGRRGAAISDRGRRHRAGQQAAVHGQWFSQPSTIVAKDRNAKAFTLPR